MKKTLFILVLGLLFSCSNDDNTDCETKVFSVGLGPNFYLSVGTNENNVEAIYVDEDVANFYIDRIQEGNRCYIGIYIE